MAARAARLPAARCHVWHVRARRRARRRDRGAWDSTAARLTRRDAEAERRDVASAAAGRRQRLERARRHRGGDRARRAAAGDRRARPSAAARRRIAARSCVCQRASPSSTTRTTRARPLLRRALDVIARETRCAPRKAAVLGEMLELGEHSLDLHDECGRAAAGARSRRASSSVGGRASTRPGRRRGPRGHAGRRASRGRRRARPRPTLIVRVAARPAISCSSRDRAASRTDSSWIASRRSTA